jgi:hypothetical protein
LTFFDLNVIISLPKKFARGFLKKIYDKGTYDKGTGVLSSSVRGEPPPVDKEHHPRWSCEGSHISEKNIKQWQRIFEDIKY